MVEKKKHSLSFGCFGKPECPTLGEKRSVRRFLVLALSVLALLSSVRSSDDEKHESEKERHSDAVIHGYLDNGNGMGEETAQKLRIEKIRNKEKYMSFRGDLRMLSDKRIGEIGIFFRKQKQPSEEEIGNRGIVSYFLRKHVFVQK